MFFPNVKLCIEGEHQGAKDNLFLAPQTTLHTEYEDVMYYCTDCIVYVYNLSEFFPSFPYYFLSFCKCNSNYILLQKRIQIFCTMSAWRALESKLLRW